jgi:hypothetical protein
LRWIREPNLGANGGEAHFSHFDELPGTFYPKIQHVLMNWATYTLTKELGEVIWAEARNGCNVGNRKIIGEEFIYVPQDPPQCRCGKTPMVAVQNGLDCSVP